MSKKLSVPIDARFSRRIRTPRRETLLQQGWFCELGGWDRALRVQTPSSLTLRISLDSDRNPKLARGSDHWGTHCTRPQPPTVFHPKVKRAPARSCTLTVIVPTRSLAHPGDADDTATDACAGIARGLAEVIFLGMDDDGSADDWIG